MALGSILSPEDMMKSINDLEVNAKVRNDARLCFLTDICANEYCCNTG